MATRCIALPLRCLASTVQIRVKLDADITVVKIEHHREPQKLIWPLTLGNHHEPACVREGINSRSRRISELKPSYLLVNVLISIGIPQTSSRGVDMLIDLNSTIRPLLGLCLHMHIVDASSEWRGTTYGVPRKWPSLPDIGVGHGRRLAQLWGHLTLRSNAVVASDNKESEEGDSEETSEHITS